jgi:hypothetical protein
MSDAGAFGLLLHAGAYIYNFVNPPEATIAGYHLTGKSTLDYRLRNECDEVPELGETHHQPIIPRRDLSRWNFLGYREKQKVQRYILPPATRKRVCVAEKKIVIRTSDLGGHEQYWHLPIEDAALRDSKILMFIIDDRDIEFVDGEARTNCFIQSQNCFNRIVNAFVTGRYMGKNRKVRRKLRKYVPDIVAIMANKIVPYERKMEDGSIQTIGGWLSEDELSQGPIDYRGHPLTRHPIFSKYTEYLRLLHAHLGIKTFRLMIDAKSGLWVKESIKYLKDNL